MSSESLEISVIIPTVGRASLLAEVLRALEGQDGNFEVVVVCDGESPALTALAADWQSQFPVQWIFCEENYGQAHARNIGAERARGDLLLFLDDDTVPTVGWVAAHRVHHSGEQRIVLGRLEHTYAAPPHTELENFMREFAASVEAEVQSALVRMDADTARHLWIGLNSSLSKTLFQRAKGYDVNLRHVEEDSELASRMADLGAEYVYEPGALVYHRSTKDLVELHLARAPLFARADLYCWLKHRAGEWPMLGTDGGAAQKLKRRLAWHCPHLAGALARACRALGEISGMCLFFRQWRDLTFFAAYWGAIKAESAIDGIQPRTVVFREKS